MLSNVTTRLVAGWIRVVQLKAGTPWQLSDAARQKLTNQTIASQTKIVLLDIHAQILGDIPNVVFVDHVRLAETDANFHKLLG